MSDFQFSAGSFTIHIYTLSCMYLYTGFLQQSSEYVIIFFSVKMPPDRSHCACPQKFSRLRRIFIDFMHVCAVAYLILKHACNTYKLYMYTCIYPYYIYNILYIYDMFAKGISINILYNVCDDLIHEERNATPFIGISSNISYTQYSIGNCDTDKDISHYAYVYMVYSIDIRCGSFKCSYSYIYGTARQCTTWYNSNKKITLPGHLFVRVAQWH